MIYQRIRTGQDTNIVFYEKLGITFIHENQLWKISALVILNFVVIFTMKKYSIATFFLLAILVLSLPTGFAFASEDDDRYDDDKYDDDRYDDDKYDDDRYDDDKYDDDRYDDDKYDDDRYDDDKYDDDRYDDEKTELTSLREENQKLREEIKSLQEQLADMQQVLMEQIKVIMETLATIKSQ
ncbi:hypothetical protein [Nitrosopumilus adriaticus]|uniref:hypothetical protein n=1 Tax=Nitrosopumilus adriaticus TaxID=1580092 RepID=UPI00352C21F4